MEDEGLYPIRTVSELTGVNSITLRAWERRYGLIEPVRKDSGHRLYTREHIDLVNRVVGLLDRGMRIGQVKVHLESERERTSQHGSEISNNAWRRYLDRMIAAVIQFSEDELEAAYGDALANYPVDEVTDKLLTPLLVELGRRWESGQGTVAEEHFFACYLRNKLGARFHHRVRNREGKRLLLACLPGDRHETGLLLFALAASEAGFRTILLGADMPLEEMPEAVRKTQCAAVVLSGLMPPSRSVIEQALPELVDAVPTPVFLGGRVSASEFDSLKRAGVEVLGTDVKKGVAQIGQKLEQEAKR